MAAAATMAAGVSSAGASPPVAASQHWPSRSICCTACGAPAHQPCLLLGPARRTLVVRSSRSNISAVGGTSNISSGVQDTGSYRTLISCTVQDEAALAEAAAAAAAAAAGEEQQKSLNFVSRRAAMGAGALAALLAAVTVPTVAEAEEAAGAAAGTAAASPAGAGSENPLIKELLERSKANKEKYDKERLEDYYRRNFKDYFDFVGGTLRNKRDLSDNDQAILEWIRRNK